MLLKMIAHRETVLIAFFNILDIKVDYNLVLKYRLEAFEYV